MWRRILPFQSSSALASSLEQRVQQEGTSLNQRVQQANHAKAIAGRGPISTCLFQQALKGILTQNGLENVKLPSGDTDVAPPYVVRAIFMYGRSYSMPVYKNNLDSYELLMKCPYFFLDVFYAHETPSQKNECHSTFEVLVDICPKPKAMVVDVCKNVTRMFDYMSRLLAHPLFRVVQEKQDHRLTVDTD